MDIKKLNACLAEMDNLTKMDLDYEKLKLTLIFNCFGGGFYENVVLTIVFRDPEVFHLPFLASGDFLFNELIGDDRLKKVSPTYMEYSPKVYELIIDSIDNGFYVSFGDIDWFVSGSGAKNEHELGW